MWCWEVVANLKCNLSAILVSDFRYASYFMVLFIQNTVLCFSNTGNRTMNLLQIFTIVIVSRTWLIFSAKLSLHINLAEEKGHIKGHKLISWDSAISYAVSTGCVFLELLSWYFFNTLYVMHGDPQKNRYGVNNAEKVWIFRLWLSAYGFCREHQIKPPGNLI